MKIMLSVQPFQETLHGGYCGPASLKIVFSYYGLDVSEAELAQKCGHSKEDGVSIEAMKEVAEKYGFKVEIHNNASFDDIESWLKKKIPVIVNWFSPGRRDDINGAMPDGHSSIVMGLDNKNIYLQDPELGTEREIPRNEFIRVWFDFKGNQITSWDDLYLRQLLAIYK